MTKLNMRIQKTKMQRMPCTHQTVQGLTTDHAFINNPTFVPILKAHLLTIGAPSPFLDVQTTTIPRYNPKLEEKIEKIPAVVNKTWCFNCQSINHWASNCPDLQADDVTCMVNEIILHNHNNDVVLKSLVSETWSSAILDSGASSTVCGKTWFEEFSNSIPPEEQAKILFTESNKPYKFGDGKSVTAIKCAKLPAYFGSQPISIQADIVDAEIPLLLSKSSMKKAGMQIDFENDSASAFGESIPLQTTHTGLYHFPITQPTQILQMVTINPSESVTLTANTTKTNSEIATKLHRCFAHPSSDKLLKLVNSAGPKWADNQDLKREIATVSDNCITCKIYKKPPPRPVVSLPMANQFQDVVALDLKQLNGKIILHLIDLCTRLSAACIIPNKNKETVVKSIFRIWVAVYGSPKKFLNDNGGEFANSDFIDMCEQLNVIPLTTPAESPWANGVVERHNQTLANMVHKIMEDAKCDIQLALCWALNAKNSLQNVAGFSPFQLAIGCNLTLPSTLHDKLPSLSSRPSSKIVEENLKALHAARSAFIESENSEKIRRSLVHNVRTSSEIKYITGDDVLYKRDDSVKWHGPGKVIGQLGQQVFVKHGAFYVRVHPCRLQLSSSIHTSSNNATPNSFPSSASPPTSSPTNPQSLESDNSDDDDDNATLAALQARSGRNLSATPQSPMETSNSITDAPEHDHNESNENPRAPVINLEVDQPQENPLTEDANLSNVQQGVKIIYRDNTEDHWKEATIDNRAGKVGKKGKGTNANWWNITESDGSRKSINLANKIWEFEDYEPSSDENETDRSVTLTPPPSTSTNKQSETEPNQAETITSQQNDETVLEEINLLEQNELESIAKQSELQEWKSRSVYDEVQDNNQPCISLRWVLKEKVISGKPEIKARLCARGFEENNDFHTDSPTCSREGLRLNISIIASNKWKIHSLDIKTAFLQGKNLERTVYVRPPKEANTNKICTSENVSMACQMPAATGT